MTECRRVKLVTEEAILYAEYDDDGCFALVKHHEWVERGARIIDQERRIHKLEYVLNQVHALGGILTYSEGKWSLIENGSG